MELYEICRLADERAIAATSMNHWVFPPDRSLELSPDLSALARQTALDTLAQDVRPPNAASHYAKCLSSLEQRAWRRHFDRTRSWGFDSSIDGYDLPDAVCREGELALSGMLFDQVTILSNSIDDYAIIGTNTRCRPVNGGPTMQVYGEAVPIIRGGRLRLSDDDMVLNYRASLQAESID
jgi:hypothetical protein